MSVYTEFEAYKAAHDRCVATIGKYDGLHLGHQHVLTTLCNTAKTMQLPSVVILSEPHPEEFFAGDSAPSRLTQFHDKVDFLLDFGVDTIFRMNFDATLSSLSAEEFIQVYLVDGLGVHTLIVGDDFRFGKNRSGDFNLLEEKGKQLGFEVLQEEPCVQDNQRISSTLVRDQLQTGDCEAVRSLLGRYYSIGGKVITGKKLGRELGTPTANIDLHVNKLPLQGIFSVLVKLGDRQLQGVASIGFNPTVNKDSIPRLEVYIFDFDEDIYGEHLVVSFVKKLRDEVEYPDLESLKNQIQLDIRQAKDTLAALAK
ncbi:MAG: bifunctional riboflavin kinase/FAD synthetase [Gammaproteobacteria bacterium]|nr:bifunctional riboflavin kinase/FAD synthetase [Gammaproteobacteria bacterium]